MIKLEDIARSMGLEIFSGKTELNRSVTGGYCGDLMSDVMVNAAAGNIWITVQMHPNIAAVASLKELSSIILANDRKPQPETLEKLESEKIPLLGSPLPAFELAAKIGALLAAGANDAAENPS